MIEMLQKLMDEQGLAWTHMRDWQASKSREGAPLQRWRLSRQVVIDRKIYLLCLESISLASQTSDQEDEPVRMSLGCSEQPEAAIILYGNVMLDLDGYRIRIQHDCFIHDLPGPSYELLRAGRTEVTIFESLDMVRLVGSGNDLPVLNDGLTRVVDPVEYDQCVEMVLVAIGSIGRMLACLYRS